MPEEPKIVIVTANDCGACEEMRKEYPDFRKVAAEVELDTKTCVTPDACGTGADFLIETMKATGNRSLNATPECLVIGPNGERGVCGDEVFDQVLEGKKPDLSRVRMYAPKSTTKKAPAPFQFWDKNSPAKAP
jgi:hypothetical protein